MIKNTWDWAQANGKVFKNKINGAEYVKVAVDELERMITEQGQSLKQNATAEFEDQQPCMYAFLEAVC